MVSYLHVTILLVIFYLFDVIVRRLDLEHLLLCSHKSITKLCMYDFTFVYDQATCYKVCIRYPMYSFCVHICGMLQAQGLVYSLSSPLHANLCHDNWLPFF